MIKFSDSRQLSIAIDRSPGAVYEFVSSPENLPRWAAGLGKSVERAGCGWKVRTPQGMMGLRFAPENSFGVLDHYVKPADGAEIYVPMRVVENGAGSEVLFTLFRQPEMTDAEFAADCALVERDLAALKAVLER
jgi:hypothetical protein